MIASEKSYQNVSDYKKFHKKQNLKLIKNRCFLEKKTRYPGNYIYDYADSFFGKDF